MFCQNTFTSTNEGAKRQEEYLQSRDDEVESSRVRYNADPEQNWASACNSN